MLDIADLFPDGVMIPLPSPPTPMTNKNKLKASPTRRFLTVKEIAALDNCSEKTVRRAIEAGLLEAVRVGPGGRLLRIDPAAHAAYRQALRA